MSPAAIRPSSSHHLSPHRRATGGHGSCRTVIETVQAAAAHRSCLVAVACREARYRRWPCGGCGGRRRTVTIQRRAAAAATVSRCRSCGTLRLSVGFVVRPAGASRRRQMEHTSLAAVPQRSDGRQLTRGTANLYRWRLKPVEVLCQTPEKFGLVGVQERLQ